MVRVRVKLIHKKHKSDYESTRFNFRSKKSGLGRVFFGSGQVWKFGLVFHVYIQPTVAQIVKLLIIFYSQHSHLKIKYLLSHLICILFISISHQFSISQQNQRLSLKPVLSLPLVADLFIICLCCFYSLWPVLWASGYWGFVCVSGYWGFKEWIGVSFGVESVWVRC